MTSEAKGKIAVPVWSDDGVTKALVDDSGTLPVTIATVTPAIDVRPHGWDLAAWRKLALLWGYTDRTREAQSELNAIAGMNTLTFSSVPAGYIYNIQIVTARNVTSVCSFIRAFVTDGFVDTTFFYPLLPSAGQWQTWTGEITLKEGDYIRVSFAACTLNDDLYARIWGYKMAIGQ